MERFIEQEAEALGLDAETTAAIRQVLEEGREQARGLDEALHEARSVMRDLLMQDVPDQGVVMRQADVIGKIETEREKHRLAALIEIRSLLTPEQRDRLMEMREEKREALREACSADLEAFCPDVRPGPGMFHCLRSHFEDVSDGCREAMPDRRHRGSGFHPGPFAP
jgi:Spy/CpxP family protein refolding chaperone